MPAQIPPKNRPARRPPHRSKTTLGESESMLRNNLKKKPETAGSQAAAEARGLKGLSEQVTALRTMTADLLLIAVAVAVMFVILSIIVPPTIKNARRHSLLGLRPAEKVYGRPLQILPFVVPEGLIKQGFTPDYLANLLRTKIGDVYQVANNAGASTYSTPASFKTAEKPPDVKMEGGEDEEADLSEVSLFDLLTFFKGAMDRYRAAHPPALEISHQKFSIKEKMEEMVGRIAAGGGRTPLSEVFRSLSGRAEAIAIFLAVLELLRLQVVRALQSAEFAEIYLESTGQTVSLEDYEEAYR